jgi:hypothetical protein
LVSLLLVLVVGDQHLLVGYQRSPQRIEAIEDLLEEFLVSEPLLGHQHKVLDKGLEEDPVGFLELGQSLVQCLSCLRHLLLVVLEE